MELITAQNLHYSNGSRTIIDGASFRVLAEKKYALIGPNGAGKTTLIRLLTGELDFDKGTLHLKERLNYSLVPQKQELPDGGVTILDYMLEPLAPYKAELEALEAKLAEADEDQLSPLLEEYQKKQDLFEAKGGYTAAERAAGLLESLGLENDLTQSAATLSGGELSLLFFARALVANPELLILDEPGNHLDYLGLAWLESYLKNFRGAVIIVSHNRYMVDAVCDEIWALYNGTLTTFTGNYSSYRVSRLRDTLIKQSEYANAMQELSDLDKRIRQIQSVTMNSYNPPKTLLVELNSLKGKVERIRKNMPEKPELQNERISWQLTLNESRSNIALEVNDLTLGFPGRPLLSDASCSVFCSEKVALVGVNGSGKTTLIKKIIEEGDWESTQIRIGPSQKIGCVSQHAVFTQGAATVEQEVRSWGAMGRDEAFSIVSRFLFTYKDLEKSLAVLSGGERNRLQLARVMYERANFLILDEPTNHMDIPACEVMEEVLSEFTGTLLVVSHDRFFLDKIAQRVIEIDEQRLISHNGNFSDFFKERYVRLPKLMGSVKSRAKERSAPVKRNNSIESQRLEQRIEEAEAKKEKLSKELERAVEKNDHLLGRQLATKLERIEREVAKLYSQWDEIA